MKAVTTSASASITLVLAVLGSGAAVPARAAPRVALEQPLKLPGLPGLAWEYKGPAEVDLDSYFAVPVTLSAEVAAVDAWLVSSGLPPRYREERLQNRTLKVTVLEEICFNGKLSMCLRAPLEGATTFRGQTDLFGLARDWPDGGGGYLSPVARYQSYFDGRPGIPRDQRGQVLVNARVDGPVLKNLPARLELPLEALGPIESVVRDARESNEQAAQTHTRISRFCAVSENRSRSEFLAFLCERVAHPALVQHLKLRFRFADQDGTSRDLVFERRAPIEMCSFVFGDAPECGETGRTRAEWERWFDLESFAAAKMLLSQGSRSGTLVFERFESFIPKEADAEVILEAAVAQVHRLRLQ